jgi:hypothetical protein
VGFRCWNAGSLKEKFCCACGEIATISKIMKALQVSVPYAAYFFCIIIVYVLRKNTAKDFVSFASFTRSRKSLKSETSKQGYSQKSSTSEFSAQPTSSLENEENTFTPPQNPL